MLAVKSTFIYRRPIALLGPRGSRNALFICSFNYHPLPILFFALCHRVLQEARQYGRYFCPQPVFRLDIDWMGYFLGLGPEGRTHHIGGIQS